MAQFNDIHWIVTDIEGTTTDVSFVYQVLFPYFIDHLATLEQAGSPEVEDGLIKARQWIQGETGEKDLTRHELIARIKAWALEDRKITPLKTLQGVLWKSGYASGMLKGHVYPDVPEALERWRKHNISLAVFSSGSVTAQQLLFRHSLYGDLSTYFTAYFDTNTGPKREMHTYLNIAESLSCAPSRVLFLSDIYEELEAADASGMCTIQLLRPGTVARWKHTAFNFTEILP